VRKFVAIAGLTLVLAACATSPGTRPFRPSVSTPPPAPPADAASAARNPGSLMAAGAMAMLGQPYRYGGAAPGGFDCSGLVVYAAGNAGIRVPRTAEEQLQAGSPVARTEVRAGDLVFMHLRAKQLHVGIAIDSTRFVHAPASGKRVRVDSLEAPPYSRSYVTARRIADAGPSTPASAAGVELRAGSSSQALVSR
jgi:cell wall-associated NlpC family hydrolase